MTKQKDKQMTTITIKLTLESSVDSKKIAEKLHALIDTIYFEDQLSESLEDDMLAINDVVVSHE